MPPQVKDDYESPQMNPGMILINLDSWLLRSCYIYFLHWWGFNLPTFMLGVPEGKKVNLNGETYRTFGRNKTLCMDQVYSERNWNTPLKRPAPPGGDTVSNNNWTAPLSKLELTSNRCQHAETIIRSMTVYNNATLGCWKGGIISISIKKLNRLVKGQLLGFRPLFVFSAKSRWILTPFTDDVFWVPRFGGKLLHRICRPIVHQWLKSQPQISLMSACVCVCVMYKVTQTPMTLKKQQFIFFPFCLSSSRVYTPGPEPSHTLGSVGDLCVMGFWPIEPAWRIHHSTLS